MRAPDREQATLPAGAITCDGCGANTRTWHVAFTDDLGEEALCPLCADALAELQENTDRATALAAQVRS